MTIDSILFLVVFSVYIVILWLWFNSPENYYPRTLKEKSYRDCSRTVFSKLYELYGNDSEKIKEKIIEYCGKHPKGDNFLDYYINGEIEFEIEYKRKDMERRLLNDKIDRDLKK